MIGFMGSGKSFVGKRLAGALSVPFYDLDEYIEEKENSSISQIFEEKGEDYFRLLERKCLRDFEHTKDAVIACGGGTPCFFDNLEWLNKHGLTIYLQTPISILLGRLQKDLNNRPLLKQKKSKEELSKYIEEKVRERSIFYKQAGMIYHCHNEEDDVVGEILNHLSFMK